MKKKYSKIYWISLIVIGIITLIMMVTRIAGIELSIVPLAALCIVDIIAFVLLIYSGIKRIK